MAVMRRMERLWGSAPRPMIRSRPEFNYGGPAPSALSSPARRYRRVVTDSESIGGRLPAQKTDSSYRL